MLHLPRLEQACDEHDRPEDNERDDGNGHGNVHHDPNGVIAEVGVYGTAIGKELLALLLGLLVVRGENEASYEEGCGEYVEGHLFL
jgi:hypothetical protein